MEITVTFIGNATTLIAVGDVTLLTDPNFLHQGQHAYLGYGLLSKRLREPALTVDQLPPVDAVVLSHMHGDHWDRVTQRQLDRSLPILTTPHAARRLTRRGFGRAQGMSTWQSHRIVKGDLTVTVTSLPGRHAPTPVDRLLPPVMGSMIEVGDGTATRRLYVSGDTLFVDQLREIPVRFSSIDLGVLHLGGTRLPAGSRLPFGLTVTMDARQGADLVELLDLPKMIPVHFDDYSVFASSLNDFRAEMASRGLGERVIELDRGASVAY
ncbi:MULTISPECIES: MBL fold metallo-hydrolase [Mycolicibacterium]|uniref:Putative Zn-dependent hydrolase of beta-lactamase fold protein n=1 Tax=Mycolicibacterium senegalense TaxID=1796 RepID=A0A378W888_9MYCO|nr:MULTISPECIES: MBL fold metallo-hydrolase [Mycolicibacterium]MCV7337232.1 MBL fold metallo-hydrolase [Mycolicibacterium senegalense]MDR7287069.1 L-ascorbate metabolism protein UlaG (beta-lactamase superfamily) [Mycolicibacterium senegalense]QZA24182.1 MBL fold metallo-hydrolase [Mycolicibacterium senegalense]CDP87914.1 Zn-dependent hydrolase of beta-lactamase fold protein [Mycolicibacterium farcinogenes]SUA29353.1 putative Zn-dependent hydrolase of beta-lactamase fold protein [Mycolicibacter